MAKLLKGFQPKQKVKSGLKILAYGVENSGKSSLFLAGFPEILAIDTEAKISPYLDHPILGKEILGVATTASHMEAIDLLDEIIKEKQSPCKCLLIDSETYMLDNLKVVALSTEEKRAKSKGGNVDDQNLSLRSYGRINNCNTRWDMLKAQVSAQGMVVLSTAHERDVYAGVDPNKVKVGVEANIKKNGNHFYDVILHLTKEKDMATGKFKYFCTVEKDTTFTFEIGAKIDITWPDRITPSTVIYDKFKDRIVANASGTSGATYGTSIDKDIDANFEESQSADEIVEQFTTLFKVLDDEGKAKVKQLLADKNVKSYKDHAYTVQVKEIVEEMKAM